MFPNFPIKTQSLNGKAIGVGHPHPSTLKSIKERIPKMKKKGIELVPLSLVLE